LLQFGSVPQVLKGFGKMPASQEFDSIFEFGKSRIFRHCSSSIASPMRYKAMTTKMR
jgi:hypothetical protein